MTYESEFNDEAVKSLRECAKRIEDGKLRVSNVSRVNNVRDVPGRYWVDHIEYTGCWQLTIDFQDIIIV
jgi:hypothetical protein